MSADVKTLPMQARDDGRPMPQAHSLAWAILKQSSKNEVSTALPILKPLWKIAFLVAIQVARETLWSLAMRNIRRAVATHKLTLDHASVSQDEDEIESGIKPERRFVLSKSLAPRGSSLAAETATDIVSAPTNSDASRMHLAGSMGVSPQSDSSHQNAVFGGICLWFESYGKFSLDIRVRVPRGTAH